MALSVPGWPLGASGPWRPNVALAAIGAIAPGHALRSRRAVRTGLTSDARLALQPCRAGCTRLAGRSRRAGLSADSALPGRTGFAWCTLRPLDAFGAVAAVLDLRKLFNDKLFNDELDCSHALEHLGAQISDVPLGQRVMQFAIAAHLIALGGEHSAE